MNTGKTGFGHSHRVEHKRRDGTQSIVKQGIKAGALPQLKNPPPPGPAIVGKNVGLTIPGPDRSYMTARIDVWCSVPCEASRAAMNAAAEYVDSFLDKQLQVDAKEITKFFESMK